MYKRFRSSGHGGASKQFNYRGNRSSNKGGFRGGNSGRNGRGPGRKSFASHIDVSKFINKATITEKTEHFVPEHKFTDFLIDNRLKTNISTKGYYVPTPIQDKAIPHILRGADVVGVANTGTGKTAAFLIPLINKVIVNPATTAGHTAKQKVMIIVPTRELALQIESEFRGFAVHLNMYAVSCVGGASIVGQMKALATSPQFVVGTPGRLRDLIERKKIKLAEYSTVVLDEADRMLDMGFIGDIRFMLAGMPATRQTLFFSATISRDIEALIKTFLKSPVTISVKTGETAEHVDQDVIRVPLGKNKFDILLELLKQDDFDKVLVFGKTKHGVERLARALSEKGLAAESIHGNKSQNQRVKALSLFKNHHMKVLVATDVAARGLDIVGVSHVINYDIPATYEDYVHRIGRTGRAGKAGKALTFV